MYFIYETHYIGDIAKYTQEWIETGGQKENLKKEREILI